MALVENSGVQAAADNPEALLNEWLGELNVLSASLKASEFTSQDCSPLEIVAPRIDRFRFSMANLEETHDFELDAILGQLSILDCKYNEGTTGISMSKGRKKAESFITRRTFIDNGSTVTRTESPDNDSAFSDTISMLSSGSSASSGASSKYKSKAFLNICPKSKEDTITPKSDKIKLALQRMQETDIKKIFIKTYSADGSTKGLLVDENMTCGYVTRLLADKNHVPMDIKWAIVEYLPDLMMERTYEDHEILVDNLMLWTWESRIKILFVERPNKYDIFQYPEQLLLTAGERYDRRDVEYDEHSRQLIIEQFFGDSNVLDKCLPSGSGHPTKPLRSPLFLKIEGKKDWHWKLYDFVLKPEGIYYSPKTDRDYVSLISLEACEVYVGLNWKKTYNAPTDHCFAVKDPKLQQQKSAKFIKFFCAADEDLRDRWIAAIRIAKHGRQLLYNYRSLVAELTQEDLDHLANARSCSITSIPTNASSSDVGTIGGQLQSGGNGGNAAAFGSSSGRQSRASSSSSGCTSDSGVPGKSAFDSDITMGTIKRKPLMKPNIPLMLLTRQMKEMAEHRSDEDAGDSDTLTPYYSEPLCQASSYTARHEPAIPGYSRTYKKEKAFTAYSEPCETPIYTESQEPTALGINCTYKKENGTMPLPSPLCETVPDNMFGSSLSLDSLPLPPPPPVSAMEDISASQLSLPPPPPDHIIETNAGRVHEIINQLKSEQANLCPGNPRPNTPRTSSLNYERSIYAQYIYDNSSTMGCIPKTRTFSKKNKSVAFEDSAPSSRSSPRKPPPPIRDNTTRLTTPKRLIDSTSNPPKDFVKDLQRVMRKKWQIAQKCKLEPATTPHEVLGFREFPLSQDYKDSSVSMWVQEHYGGGVGVAERSCYENMNELNERATPMHREESVSSKRKSPPKPPPRSGSTQLSTQTNRITKKSE